MSDRDDDLAARAICRHHAKSFYFASHFLPRAKRQHAYNVYAFCRLLDDAADENPSPASVEAFVATLDAVYAGGTPREPALRAFARTVRTCGIPKRHFLDLADGCRMDFTVTRYADWPSLERYCYHVAGVVGLIMCRVFGLRDASALARAVHMGNAMQLTNILRDVGEDFSRGRVYLPQDEMARFGVTVDRLRQGDVDANVRAMIRFQIDRARSLYAQASLGLRQLPDDGSRLTACVMAVLYAGILRAIERRGYDVLRGRAHLTIGQKLCRLYSAWRLSRWTRGPMPTVF